MTALALNPEGEPWIAEALLDQNNLGQGTLVIRHRHLGVWTGETLGITTRTPSIEVDLNRDVHVLYQTLQGPTYAWHTPSGWTQEPFAPADAIGSLRLDGYGRVHVVYVDSSRHLYYATRTPSGWTSVLVDGTSRANDPQLAFTGWSRAHIVYADVAPDGMSDRLMYVEDRPDIGWTKEPISPAGSVIWEYSLAVAAGNIPYVAFRDMSVNHLRATWRANGVWTTETVDALPGAGEHPSIATDGYQPIIAYKSDSSTGVRLASGAPITLGVDSPASPAGLRILGSRPNPVRSGNSLRITVASPQADRVRLEAFDASGRSIGRSALMAVAAGQTRLEWAAQPRPGLLFLRATSEAGRTAVARVVVVD